MSWSMRVTLSKAGGGERGFSLVRRRNPPMPRKEPRRKERRYPIQRLHPFRFNLPIFHPVSRPARNASFKRGRGDFSRPLDGRLKPPLPSHPQIGEKL